MTIIYLITTGDTIEKVYSEQTGSVQNQDNKIDRYLGMLRLPDSEVRVMPLMNSSHRFLAVWYFNFNRKARRA